MKLNEPARQKLEEMNSCWQIEAEIRNAEFLPADDARKAIF